MHLICECTARSVAPHPIPSQSPIPTLAIGNREASFAPQCRPAGNDQKPSGYAQSYMVAICSTLQTRTRVCVQKVGRIAEARSWRWVSLILTCSLIINFQLLSLNACWAGGWIWMAWRGVRDCMRGLALRRSVFVCWRLLGSGQSRRRASGGIKSSIVGRVVISLGGVREALSIRMEAFGKPAERVAKEDASAESNRTQRRETQQCLYAL